MATYHQKEDVIPAMLGLWEKFFSAQCGWESSIFNKKHQPCPCCGGTDRFRWTDKIETKGDGGAVCAQCGSGSGAAWYMKYACISFEDAINDLGDWLNLVPVEVRKAANKIARRDSGYNFGRQIPHERCEEIMSRTIDVPVTPTSIYEGIGLLGDEMYKVGVKTLESGGEELIHALPCHMVHNDGLDEEMCNVLFIDESGNERFAARDYTRGSVIPSGTIADDKCVYLCTDWIKSQHFKLASGKVVWACFSPSNLEIVAYRLRNSGYNVRVVCDASETDTLIAAEERGLDVIVTIDDNARNGFVRKLFNPSHFLSKSSCC